jgi:ABC-type transport system involved in cytochrome c biogenesis permease subunit
MKFPKSRFGALLALIYIVVAMFVVRADRRDTSGGWITLRGVLAYIVTLPVSAVGEKLRMTPDYRRNTDMAFAIIVCAGIVYLLGALIGKIALMIVASARSN